MRKILSAIGLMALAVLFVGATTPNSFIAPQVPNIGTVRFVQGTDSAGTYKTIYTGAANGSKCFALMLNHNDQGASHLITLRINHSSTDYDIATYTTVTGLAANTFGVTANLFSTQNWPGLATDATGNPFIYLTNGDLLKATFATSLTASDQINIIALCADF